MFIILYIKIENMLNYWKNKDYSTLGINCFKFFLAKHFLIFNSKIECLQNAIRLYFTWKKSLSLSSNKVFLLQLSINWLKQISQLHNPYLGILCNNTVFLYSPLYFCLTVVGIISALGIRTCVFVNRACIFFYEEWTQI